MKAVKRKPVLTVEPELCPSAVQYWANDNTKNGRGNSEVTEKARRHLSALGWKFWYATKKQKIELRYESPTGKVYYSLRMACQACVNYLGRGVFSESIGSNSVECSATLDINDDICTVCHFGGDLILCDRCPAAFHISCLGLKDVSEGDWFCPSCCCVKCGKGNPKEDRNNGLVICGQCDKKYHYGCLRNEGVEELERDSKGNWFCSRKCEGIYLGINKIVGKRILVGPDNLTWTLLRPSPPSDSDMEDLTENYSKLNLALSVMHECFEPSQDPYTKRDIVEDIIFNRESDLSRLNFRRFYTLLLERDEEVITVACVRIYSEVVEVPLVATRFHYRRQGMCRVLMDELENQLANLGVERLILPSASSTLDTWTSTSFGFSKMTADERTQFLNYTFMDFQGTIMCHKVLKQTNSATQAIIPFEGSTKFDELAVSWHGTTNRTLG
ncbi:hypothetical protein D8674_015363 [Pyrus ussuriensis x Pyrus communis]|uniref:Uncharacterized protein n=1 Tax=Pyrus ussuriensis x Pyrus communis TaxID=2448454 RepID=A0A5N5H8L6_9ROSA|nr:hypothetical protein D8674_015363 [Pyrus ussuriensis x Pyrus communis]